MDIVDRQTRSRMMSGIRSRNTKPEILVRSWMHRHGLRFRLHRSDLPGTPDLVFPKYRTALFVHGCFWHRHPGCRFATTPRTNTRFWRLKFRANVRRDRMNLAALRQLGWHVVTVWECEIDARHLNTVRRAIARRS